MSLHQSTQELMSILASDKTDVQLRTDLEDTLAIDAVGSEPAFGRRCSHMPLVSYSRSTLRIWQKTNFRRSR
jgi:hypothetical protein